MGNLRIGSLSVSQNSTTSPAAIGSKGDVKKVAGARFNNSLRQTVRLLTIPRN